MLTTFLPIITSEIQILNVLLVWNATLGFTSTLQSSSLSLCSTVSTCKCSLDIANRPTKKVHIACQTYIQITNVDRNILMLGHFEMAAMIKFCLPSPFLASRLYVGSVTELKSCKHRISPWFFIPLLLLCCVSMIYLVFQATNNLSKMTRTCIRIPSWLVLGISFSFVFYCLTCLMFLPCLALMT